MNLYYIGLQCGLCGKAHDHTRPQNLCLDCGKPLLAQYDLAAVSKVFTKEILRTRPKTLWRYREVMPVSDDAHM